MKWTPASEQEVRKAIAASWTNTDLDLKARLTAYLVEPKPAWIERFRKLENAFIVARLGSHVVFFDDVEEVFGIAIETQGKLCNADAYNNITLALRELERLSATPS